MKQKLVQKEKQALIDGLEDFPLELLGLTVDSIEKSNGHIIIPIELLPYLKIHKQSVLTRNSRSKIQHKYLLRLKANDSYEYLRNKSKLPKKRGAP
jgi:hypothetical protein